MMSREALAGPDIGGGRRGYPVHLRRNLHGLDYAFPAVTAAELSPHALVIIRSRNIFRMTGWGSAGWWCRNRWCGRPNDCSKILPFRCRRCRRLAAEVRSKAASRWRDVKRGYQENRRILIAGLPASRDRTNSCPPTAHFTSTPTVSKFTSDSFEFAKQMLEQAHVAANSRHRLSIVHGHQFIRFSYARSADGDARAVARIARLARIDTRPPRFFVSTPKTHATQETSLSSSSMAWLVGIPSSPRQ